jgi:hypothetical protein
VFNTFVLLYALATTLLTWRGAGARFGLAQTMRELRWALRNRQLALIFVIVLLTSAIRGTTTNIGIYVTTYFWGLTTEALRWFALSAGGALVGFSLVAAVHRRCDKKRILLACGVGTPLGVPIGLLTRYGITRARARRDPGRAGGAPPLRSGATGLHVNPLLLLAAVLHMLAVPFAHAVPPGTSTRRPATRSSTSIPTRASALRSGATRSGCWGSAACSA